LGNACYFPVQNLFVFLSRNLNTKIHKTIILPVVLYGCEIWSLTLRQEHRLRVCENRVLTRIYGPRRKDVARGWKRLHNEELHNLHDLDDMDRACSMHGRYDKGIQNFGWKT